MKRWPGCNVDRQTFTAQKITDFELMAGRMARESEHLSQGIAAIAIYCPQMSHSP